MPAQYIAYKNDKEDGGNYERGFAFYLRAAVPRAIINANRKLSRVEPARVNTVLMICLRKIRF